MKKLSLIILFTLLLVSSVSAIDFEITNLQVNPTPVATGENLTLSITLGSDDFTANPMRVAVTCCGGVTLPQTTPVTIPFVTGIAQAVVMPIPQNACAATYQARLTVTEQGTTDSATRDFEFRIVADLLCSDIRNPRNTTNTTQTNQTNTSTGSNVELKFNGSPLGSSFGVILESGEDENELTLSVHNTGTQDLTNLQVAAIFSDLEDDDGDLIEVTQPNTISTLVSGTTSTIIFNFDVESGYDMEQLVGALRVTSNAVTLREIPFTINVRPLACQLNARTGDLDLKIEDPDDNDEFERGDIIHTKIELENIGNNDIDSKIRAILYNQEDDRILDTITLSKGVNEDNEEVVDFDLEIGENVDDGDKIKLLIKVYDEDNELDSCTLEELDLDVEVPDHKINIDNVLFSQSTAICSGQVSGTALVKNVGKNDEDVVVEIYNRQLGISTFTPAFEVEEEKDYVVSFSFRLPADIAAGAYQISLNANYDDENTLVVTSLNVPQCEETTAPIGSSTTDRTNTGTLGAAITGAMTGTDVVDYTETDFFDLFNNQNNKLPLAVWILIDILIVLIIFGILVWIFKSR